MHQKMMTKVLLSLIPLFLMAIYLFGWRVIIMLAVVLLAGSAAEVFVMKQIQKDKFKLTEACFVSCALYTLTLPPATPLWIAAIGILFGIVFGKTAFGGFGYNIFNPALVARCFVYIAFPTHLTYNWTEPFKSLPGGFGSFSGGVDMLTHATPMISMKAGGELTPISDLFFGFISGSMGETSALLILLAAVYLIWTKTASWKIILSTFASAGILSAIFFLTGVSPTPPQYLLLSGGLLFATVFMATDPISAPRGEGAKWIYGLMIGAFAVVIRRFSLFNEGIMFAILIANALVPLIERNIREYKQNSQKKQQADKAVAEVKTSATASQGKEQVTG